MSTQLNKYIAVCKEQEEAVTKHELKDCIIDGLVKFERRFGEVPVKMVIYRDGVSISQQRLIHYGEIPDIQSGIDEAIKIIIEKRKQQNEAAPEKKQKKTEIEKPKICFIVANKSSATRYFKKDDRGIQSVLPGTYVSDSILELSEGKTNDFYLVSQIARKGAPIPTHYHIVFNEFDKESKEKIIQLTYRLCYLYFHINAGIKVPAPVQYAERLGTLLGEINNSRGDDSFVLPGKRFSDKPSLFFI